MTASTSSRGKWLALTAALLGWMFDGAEMGLFSMVGRSAIRDLMGTMTGTADEQTQKVAFLFSVITAVFLVGAATGGVLFGWLGDRIGRVRAMSLSVLTYAIFTGLCGFAQAPWQVAILRFIASLGMGGEWALGVALVMEIWPNKSRGLMAGLIGAAANVGYTLVGCLQLGLSAIPEQAKGLLQGIGLPDPTVNMLVANDAWRLMMLMGTAPALLTFLFRMFVPESAKWEEQKAHGGVSHWDARDLLGILIGALGPALILYVCANDFNWQVRLVGSLVGVLIATVGYVFPVVQYLRRQAGSLQNAVLPTGVTVQTWPRVVGRMLLASCLSGIALLGTWGSTQHFPSWAAEMASKQAEKADSMKDEAKEGVATTEKAKTGEAKQDASMKPKTKPRAAPWTMIWLSLGAITGTILAALAGDLFGRRITYFMLCVLSLGSVLVVTLGNPGYGPQFLGLSFVAGLCTASFYGWLPLYLPELFGTNIRATGQGFSFNFGRILAAVGTLQLSSIKTFFESDDMRIMGVILPKGYPALLSTVSLVYILGMVMIWLMPETKGKPLPE